MFGHLRGHLKSQETVTWPFKNCNCRTNPYSSFNAHKSRKHSGSSDICDDLASTGNASSPSINTAVLDGEDHPTVKSPVMS